MERWSFVEGRTGAWLWRCVGSLRTRQSGARFPTLLAALDDAAAHGLTPGSSRLAWIVSLACLRSRRIRRPHMLLH